MGRYLDAILGSRGELAAALDGIPELRGCGIGAQDGEDLVSSTIRDSSHGSGLRTFVVIEIVVDDTPTPESIRSGGSRSETRYWTDDRGGRLATESLGLAFNCGGAVLAGMAVAGSGAGTVATAGAASPLVVVTSIAAVGAALQCGVSIGRVINVLSYDEAGGGTHPNDYLDSSSDAAATTLRVTLIAADIVGLVDGAAGAYSAVRTFSRRAALTGGNHAARAAAARELLASMSAAERAQLAREIADLMNQPLTPRMLRTLVEEGRVAGMGSVRFGRTLQEILRRQLTSSVRGLTLGLTSSVTGGAIGAATGSSDATGRVVRSIVANVFQEGI